MARMSWLKTPVSVRRREETASGHDGEPDQKHHLSSAEAPFRRELGMELMQSVLRPRDQPLAEHMLERCQKIFGACSEGYRESALPQGS